VIGATAIDTRSGEFYIFRSKATIIATGNAARLFDFAPELTASGSMRDVNSAGVGQAIGWDAGAEFVCMEMTSPGGLLGYGYAPYSMGNASNTYHGVSIIDADGKELPWVDVFGRELKTVDDRFYPQEGQPFQLGIGIGISQTNREFRLNDIPMDVVERIRNGEFKLPLYCDLTRMSDYERKVLWGMMVGNEGKTRIPIYNSMSKAGFDPEKDLFQAPVMPPNGYFNACYWAGMVNNPSNARGLIGGGYLVDWDLRTNLEGLYAAAGGTIFGGGCHGESHTTGRYAGRKAAEYAQTAPEPVIDGKQVDSEKAKAYTAVKQDKGGNGWKEINAAIARIMKDYCGQYKNETTLNLGLRLLNELRETELASAYASNPHELGRLLECQSLITVGELVMKTSLERKASNSIMDFHRLDYPEMDPPEWNVLLPTKQETGKVTARKLPLDFHLKPPYAPTLEENYKIHCGL
jgi:succinate dehydrogenase/fumarate reductase flavoprotein subunit